MPAVVKENVVLKREDYISMQPWVSPSGKIAFLPVPKVASTTMTRVLSHENRWTRRTIPEGCTLFALIRHPYDRWISGTTEHWNPILTKGGNDLTPLFNTDPRVLLEQSYEDRHTQPQCWNFDKYPGILLIKFHHMFMVWNWIGVKDNYIHERNPLTMGGLQQKIKEVVAVKAQLIEKEIENSYSEDMQLWNKAI